MLPRRCWRYTFCGTKTSLMQSTRVAKSAPPITMNLVVKYDEQSIKTNEVMVPDVASSFASPSFIGWRPSPNTAVGKRPYWEYDEQSIEQMKWCYLMSHSFASPISAVNHRRRVNLIHGASLIRLANSWTFDSPRQFMDLAYVTWFAAYQLT